MSGSVYVSHAVGENEVFVRHLIGALKIRFPTVLTGNAVPAPDADAIATAIDQSELVVVVVGRRLTAQSNLESFVFKELDYAKRAGVPIVPVYIEDVTSEDLPYNLQFLFDVEFLRLTDGDVTLGMNLRQTVDAIHDAAVRNRQSERAAFEDAAVSAPAVSREKHERLPTRSTGTLVTEVEALRHIGLHHRQSALGHAPPPPSRTMAAAPPPSAEGSRSTFTGLALFGLGAGAVAWLIASGTAASLGQQLLAALNIKLNGFGIFGFLARTPITQQPITPVEHPKSDLNLVNCSVFAPAQAPDGERAMVQVFLHSPEDAKRASATASLMNPSIVLRGVKTLDVDIARGTRVDVILSCPELEIPDGVQSLIWRGDPVFSQFLIEFPRGILAQSQYHLTVRLVVDGALVGRLMFTISRAFGVPLSPNTLAGRVAQTYRNAFVSYASEDRKAVLERVQMLKATRLDFFQDILSLDPGARWEKEIYRRIDECDLFLLFWSNAAKSSEWVVREAEYALARHENSDGLAPDIAVIALEGPPPVIPPASLAGLHVDDPLRYIMAAS